MQSNLHEELQARIRKNADKRLKQRAQRDDKIFLGLAITLGIIAIIGFGFCLAYNIPIYG